MLTAILLNGSFTIIEIVGGFLTNSVTILSDAVHDLGDTLALTAAWYFERLSRKGRDKTHSYGYRRYTVLGAIINAIVLITGSVFVITEAIRRLNAPEAVHSTGMILLAVLGIAINGLAFSRLRSGHSHNVDVMRLHLLEDVLGWVVALLGAVVIQIWSLFVLDPILSLLVSAWILFQVVKRLRKSMGIILQNTPGNITTQSVDELVRSLPGIRDTHDTHLWTLDGEYHILTLHVVTDKQQSMSGLAQLKEDIRKKLALLRITHATIEFEYPEEYCVHETC